jgi:hypothetical protein
MSVEIIPRAEWGAVKPRRRTLLPPSQLDGVCIHWFGSPTAARSHDECPALLRSVQQGHLNNKQENYSDIAYCVDAQTEALTVDGWKRYDQLREDDLVVTLDHDTGEAEWQPVERVNIFPAADREMVSIEGHGHSSLTTLNHRWPVERTRRRTGTVRIEDERGRWAATGRAPTKVALRERMFVTSEALSCWDRIPTAAPVTNLPESAVYADAFVELVAWAWTEGHVNRSRGRLTTGLTLYQSHVANPHLVDRIRACLTELYGAPLQNLRARTALPGWRHYRNGHKTEFRLNHVAGRQVLEVMSAPDKIVATSFVTSLTEPQLRRFVEVSLLADGYTQGPTSIVTQGIEARLEPLEIAAVILGLRTYRFQDQVRGRPRYGLRISTSQRSRSFWPHRTEPQRVEHDGVVWCPTTPNGTWLARRHGAIYFTGNSHAVCPHGSAYELRGFGVQTGANGFGAANRSHASIVYMAGTGDTFTEEAKQTLAEVIREWQKQGAGLDVKPHGFFTGSSCPGPDVLAWLPQKLWALEEKQVPAKDETPDWLMDFVQWRLVDDADPAKRPEGLPRRIPSSAWETASRVHKIVNLMGPQDPFLDWAEWRDRGGRKSTRPHSLPTEIPKPWWAALKRLRAGAKQKPKLK